MNLKEKKLMFENRRDISLKLEGVIVWTEEGFFNAHVSEESSKLHLFPFGNNGSKKIVDVVSDEWNIKFPKLGYINVDNKQAYYVSQGPSRSNRISVSLSNLKCESPNNKDTRGLSLQHFTLNHTVLNNFFQNTNHIGFEKALDRIKKDSKRTSIAASNDVCLFKDSMNLIKVAYKNTTIGWMSNKKPATILIPESLKNMYRNPIVQKSIEAEFEVIKNV
jgi:hypothetical protein